MSAKRLTGAALVKAFQDKIGYEFKDPERLLDAVPLENGKFGQYYEIRGTLSGPTGVVRAVRTIWITEHLSGITKFVTLTPNKRSTT